MRTIFVRTLACTAPLAAALSLSACMMFPVGPDLAKAPSPFGDAAHITLGDPDKSGDAAAIVHAASGDLTTVTLSDSSPRGTYEAAVSWRAFDGRDPAHYYWLVGLNVFRSPDRSAYVLMRYPHGLKIAAPFDSDAFEILPLTCDMRGASPFGPKMTEDEAQASYADGTETPAPEVQTPPAEPAPPTEQPICDFRDMAEVEAFVPTVLDKAREAEGRPEDEGGDYHWSKTHVTIP